MPQLNPSEPFPPSSPFPPVPLSNHPVLSPPPKEKSRLSSLYEKLDQMLDLLESELRDSEREMRKKLPRRSNNLVLTVEKSRQLRRSNQFIIEVGRINFFLLILLVNEEREVVNWVFIATRLRLKAFVNIYVLWIRKGRCWLDRRKSAYFFCWYFQKRWNCSLFLGSRRIANRTLIFPHCWFSYMQEGYLLAVNWKVCEGKVGARRLARSSFKSCGCHGILRILLLSGI